MTETLHVIEPTLESEAGHCHSFIASLFRGSASHPVWLWASSRADLKTPGSSVRLIPHFSRRIRRVQAYFLYRRLLRRPGRIFIATAGRTDLMLLDWAAPARIPSRKVYLYFHWVRPTEKKMAFFRKIAARHPDLIIMGPTESVVEIFRNCGFRNAHVVPYPITPAAAVEGNGPVPGFSHLLFAGAAREDKGIVHVAGFLDYLAKRNLAIPFFIQTSADHYNKYDKPTKEALDRLSTLKYPGLRLQPATLQAADYHALYAGAICLQLYNQKDFADRISGITLDALSAGSPVITLENTWMARMVRRFGVGIVLEDTEPERILEAVQNIIGNYGDYQRKAFLAGKVLQEENSAAYLFTMLAA